MNIKTGSVYPQLPELLVGPLWAYQLSIISLLLLDQNSHVDLATLLLILVKMNRYKHIYTKRVRGVGITTSMGW